MNRREMLLALAGGRVTLLRSGAAVERKRSRLGIVVYALGIHQRHHWAGRHAGLAPTLAFLEDPLETARAFAPFALTVHLKDLAAKAYADGWLLADVALGDGFLALKEIVAVLRAAQPDVKFNLETITRDPLMLPVRTDAFWATLPAARPAASELVPSLVNAKPGVPFPGAVSKQPVAQQLELERQQVERSIAYAREQLGR